MVSIAVLIGIIVSLVGFTIVSLIATSIANESIREGGYIPPPETPLFVGKPVLVLGDSPNTDGIVNRLLLSTDNVTVAANLGDMPQYYFDGVIMVDGTWGSEQPVNNLAATLGPYVLNGTPLALINMTCEVITAIGANHDPPFMGGSSASNGVPVMVNGFWHRPTTGFNSQISLGTGSASGYWNAITELYEWGTLRA